MGRFDVYGLRRFFLPLLCLQLQHRDGLPHGSGLFPDAARRFSLFPWFFEEDGGKFGKFDWYNFFVILGSVTIFAVLLRPAGLIPATAVMVFLSSFGNRPFRWIRTLLLCVFLSVAVWLIFVLGLDLTVPIWPAFLTN